MAEGDLSPEEAVKLVGLPEPVPHPALPLTNAEIAAMGATGSSVNAPPALGDTRRRQEALGERPGIPFHEEGLPTWTDLMAKSRESSEAKIRYLATKFGRENVRLNEYNEPVVTITNPDTGQREDYPLNPHQLTVRNLTSLARFAPDVAGAAIGAGLPAASRNILIKALAASAGAEAGGALREIGAQALEPASGVDIQRPITEHIERIPADMLFDLGLTGVIKGAQFVTGLLTKGKIPNPIAGTPLTMPARPEFTKEGVEAAGRLAEASGISPELRPSETTGIPLMAMLEQYMERKPAGASPLIQAGAKREAASKAIQNWMTDPSTLATDEEIGRKGLAALKRTIEPYEKDVELAKFAVQAESKGAERLAESQMATARIAKRAELEAAQQKAAKTQQAGLLREMNVASIPENGLDLGPLGATLRESAVKKRDAFQTEASRLYDAVFSNPKANEPIIGGGKLKGAIDELRESLPAVTKDVERETGVLGPSGVPITQTVEQRVPISTPIRPRLDELSAKLNEGRVSLNDLKQVRTDLGDAIKQGEAIPGVKEGRLKRAYAAVSDAIDQGLDDIGDPALKSAWDKATAFYSANVTRFKEKNVGRLFREAEQSSSVGDSEFARRAIANADSYDALREFYGAASPEIKSLHVAARMKVLADSATVDGLVDGPGLIRQLKSIKSDNPILFQEAFGGKGNAFIRAAQVMGDTLDRIPMSEVDKLLNPAAATRQPMAALARLQTAQDRLAEEYQNTIVAKFLKGDMPGSALKPDRFVSSLPEAKLSDVRDVMTRLKSEAPDVAEQVQRKSIQNLLQESRRTATPTDTMAKLQGQPGDLISGIGLANALGKGDQLEKYKVILGDLYPHLIDYAKMELLGEERRRISQGVGMLAPGSAMNMLVKALTPWEGGPNKAQGMFKELSGLARDKILSTVLSSKALRDWLVSPYALQDASAAIKIALVSEPFLRGMGEEFKDTKELAHVLSALKVGFGTAGGQTNTTAPATRSGDLSPEEASRLVPR